MNHNQVVRNWEETTLERVLEEQRFASRVDVYCYRHHFLGRSKQLSNGLCSPHGSWLVSERAPVHRWPLETARRYLGQLLKYEVGQREREGCQLFIDMAAEIGAVAPRKLEFVDR